MLGKIIILIMEWIGTIAFSVSGSLVAINCSLDLFGVIIVGCVTAVGGGMIRDILIGKIPPQIFFSPQILLVSIITSIFVFVLAYIKRQKFESLRERIENINVFFDALGLAAFSVAGVEIARSAGYEGHMLISITLGALTGIGGGVLRDVLVNEKPYVLTRHIYALASIFGCVVYYFISVCWNYRILGTALAVVLIVLTRMLAAKFRWKLPKIKVEDIEKTQN